MNTNLKGQKSTDSIVQTAELFEQGLSLKQIAKVLEINESTVSRRLNKLGLRKFSRKKTTILEKDLLVIYRRNQNGESLSSLCREFGYSDNGVKSALNTRGYTTVVNDMRKYSCNDNIFSKIDTEEKAYWLGYMYADGYNREDENYIEFSQAKQDKSMVYKFKEFLEFDGVVKITEKSKQNDNWQDIYNIKVTSQQISQDLSRHGCMQAKTHLVKFPDTTALPKDLQRHFIRGYFDGDGSLQLNRWDIVGTIDFVLEVQKILMSELGLNKTKLSKRHTDRDTNIRTLIYGGRRNLEKIYFYLYKDSTIWSERKYSLFTEYRKQQKDVVDKKDKIQNKRNLEILKLHEKGVSRKEIGKQFNITSTRVTQILNA